MLEEMMEKLEKINKNIQYIINCQLQETNTLKKISDVAKYLDKSPKTISNYIRNGKFEINKHYYKNLDGKIEFIQEAIIEFKKNPFVSKNESHHYIPVEIIFDSSSNMHPISYNIVNSCIK